MTAKSTSSPLTLAVNAGSSSLKASLIQQDCHVATFLGERLTTEGAVVHFTVHSSGSKTSKGIANCDHEQALHEILDFIKNEGNSSQWWENLRAVGHRVVHGGNLFTKSVVVTDEVLEEIESVSHLAPLHNPHNVAGIKMCREAIDVPQVAVFDTAFHSTIPDYAKTYPIPAEYRKAGIRKYGFHGTSVHFVARQAEQMISKLRRSSTGDDGYSLIVCHLGNGASVTAVQDGKSVETSMGFTPTSGLMMGTRAGSVDPGVVSFAVHEFGKDVDQVLNDLNKESGLKAMTAEHDNDMRSLLKQAKEGHSDAILAIEMFVYRLAQHIASSAVALSKPLDALVFTAGIGEHSSEIRRRCIDQMKHIFPNLELDSSRNEKDGEESDGVLSPAGRWPLVLDIATDEEVMIAQESLALSSAPEPQ